MGCANSSEAGAAPPTRRSKVAKPATKPARQLSGEDLTRKRLNAPAAFKRLHFLPRRFEDDYELDEAVLGTGYSGDVHLGRSKRSGAKVAVKTFVLGNADENQVEQALDEAEIYLALDHPHVVRLHDVYVETDRLHLVMECMEGGEFFDRIAAKKSLSEEEAAKALRQMLTAVAYMHSQGIVHCDLKLENFLMEQKEGAWLKLCDFGFSQLCPPNSALYKQAGTMKYMAPGVFQGCYTATADCWSMGVIAHILLTGHMPFQGTDAELSANIMSGNWNQGPELWGSRSEALDFVQGLLHLDPSKRLTCSQALAHPWLCQHAPVQALAPEPRVVAALQAFSRCSPLQRAGFATMAWTLNATERAQVRETFLAMDTSVTGTLSAAELCVALGGIGIDSSTATSIFNALDLKCKGHVAYSDFLAAMCISPKLMSEQRITEVFDAFDCENTGMITAESLRELSKSCSSLSTCVEALSPCTSLSSVDFAAQLRSAASHPGSPVC